MFNWIIIIAMPFIVIFDGDLFAPCRSYQNQW